MKIALISDTHFGVRNDNQVFLEKTKNFMENLFFPTLKERQINTIIHLGDLFDRRKYINFYTLNQVNSFYIDRLHEFDYHQILGNHDTYFKNTNKINSIREIYKDKFHIYEEPTEVMLQNKKFLFVPWICEENREHVLSVIQNSAANYCFGHFEIEGFRMFSDNYCETGLHRTLFSQFDKVFSGHFHAKSQQGNITYVGSHMQYTWGDYGDERGFHIFDTDTNELEFIANPNIMFHRILYTDNINKTIDFSKYANTYVKVVIKEKNNSFLFERFLSALERSGVFNIQIADLEESQSPDVEFEFNQKNMNTIDMIFNYIDNMNIDNTTKSNIKTHVLEAYNIALRSQNI